MIDWQGVFPAIATQFREDLSLDLEATGRGISQLIADGVDGIVALGTSGENFTLDHDEKRALLAAARNATRGRAPLLAGIAECSTGAAQALARDAAKIGCDGLLAVPGLVYKASGREILHHYRAIARVSSLPIMIYNNPGTYGSDVTVDMVGELAAEPAFVALKESSGELSRVTAIVQGTKGGFRVFCGADEIILESIAAGATGWISGLVNAFPKESIALFAFARDGRLEEARAIFDWFRPVLALDSRTTLVQCLKLAAEMNGRGSARVRAPRLELEGAERRAVVGIIERAMETRPELGAMSAA
ncbi:MAG: dihydrodipicolinate synthase family protein [Proteobacteria bacterium]|nr:dihydrodipicolinate synthase family protein [Pseudomonadota bacterium]